MGPKRHPQKHLNRKRNKKAPKSDPENLGQTTGGENGGWTPPRTKTKTDRQEQGTNRPTKKKQKRHRSLTQKNWARLRGGGPGEKNPPSRGNQGGNAPPASTRTATADERTNERQRKKVTNAIKHINSNDWARLKKNTPRANRNDRPGGASAHPAAETRQAVMRINLYESSLQLTLNFPPLRCQCIGIPAETLTNPMAATNVLHVGGVDVLHIYSTSLHPPCLPMQLP